jgi:predicted outer membrane repeat protein
MELPSLSPANLPAVLFAGLVLFGPHVRAANPDLLFGQLPDFSDGGSANFHTALGDLNGDGKPDLIRSVPGNIRVYLGLGNGRFAAGISYAAGDLPAQSVVADLNNDGKLDVVVANRGAADGGSMSVLLGNGNGTLQTQSVLSVGFVVNRMVVTDYNKDNKADILAVGYPSGSIPTEGRSLILSGNGDGTFGTPVSYGNSARTAYPDSRDIVAGDFNGDTWPDFVVSNALGYAIAVFFNNQDGTFTRRAKEMQVIGNVASLATGDFNADGKQDLAITFVSDMTYGNTGPGNNVGVVDGNGDGSFGTLNTAGGLDSITNVRIYSATSPGDKFMNPNSRMLSHDMDGDGKLDLVMIAESSLLSVLRGAGDGTFSFGTQLGTSGGTLWMSVADLNADGAVDIVATPNNPNTQTFVGIPPGSGSTVVTTTVDEDNGTADPAVGAGTSLREALNYNALLGGGQIITFDSSLAGQTVELSTVGANVYGSTAYWIQHPVTIQGLTGSQGITIARTGASGMRLFAITPPYGGSLTLNDLTITNWSGGGGGAILAFRPLTVNRCTFVGNSSGGEGGAIASDFSTLSMTNCTLTGNSASNQGGAIHVGASNSSTVLRHLTVTGNSAGFGGGGIRGSSAVQLTNSIVCGNLQGAASSDLKDNVSGQNNMIGTGGSGGLVDGVDGNIVGLPTARFLLGSLAANGGPTPTIPLLSGSPAINSGTTISGLATDQRGSARTVASAPDIGAFENETGDDDPDGDVINNLAEARNGTSPVLIDTDSDGFNDATEILNGKNPLSAGSQPDPTRIERVLGYGPARGLDLSGTFVHAFNVGTPGAAGQAGDAYFTADNAAGVTVSAPNEIVSWATRDFGASPNDTTLETVLQSIRWADISHSTPNLRFISVTLGNLAPGNRYKLQLLFAESGDWNRRFDVRVDGVLVADDFCPSDAQGTPVKTYAAAAVVHEFTATGTSAHIVLSGADVATPAVDFNPILNGVTLEQTAVAAPIVQWRALHGLATDGSQDFDNPSGDGVANLLKYAFNMAPDAGDLLTSNRSILIPGGTTGLPAITRNATPQLIIQFVRRKATINPGVTYTVEVCTDLSDPEDWSSLDLSGATVESIDNTWERVTITDPTSGPRRFGRLSVQSLGP